jgi:hypothetical protein
MATCARQSSKRTRIAQYRVCPGAENASPSVIFVFDRVMLVDVAGRTIAEIFRSSPP